MLRWALESLMNLRLDVRVLGVLLAAMSIVFVGGCASGPTTADNLAEVKTNLTGHFSSAKQAATDQDYFDISLKMAETWTDRSDGPWLYVEQAMAAKLDKPYRQRVYRLHAEKDGAVVSEVYEFKSEPLQYAGEADKPTPLAKLTPADLVLKDGCAVTLRRQSDGTWSGGTGASSCPSTLRGAAYANSQISALSLAGLTSWDRGYDKDGKQVWGAEKGGYRFDRVK
jgi:hypothetical protein